MQWFNVPVDVLQRPEFSSALPSELGVWLRLSCYCATQENGGKIHDCSRWTDRQWLIAAGVTSGDVRESAKLWRWDKVGGLVVSHYPSEKEREVQAKRKAGKETAKRRWGKKMALLNGSSPHSSAISSADAEEEMEGKGMRERDGSP